MAILSSDVNPGDDALAAQYNNLRADLLTGDVTIAGVKTFSSSPVFSAGITAASIVDLVITNSASIVDLIITNSATINATKKLYLGASYFTEHSANAVRLYCDGVIAMAWGAVGGGVISGKKLLLDGSGDAEYIIRSGAGVVDYYVGNAIQMRMDANGIAPGDNESMMWDVVEISLDGTSPDTVGYVIDELKVKGLHAIGHVTNTLVVDEGDIADAAYTACSINADNLQVFYGVNLGSGDRIDVKIFYVA